MNDLRSAVRGRVLLPGDPGFDAARRPWNLAVEQPAAAVVEAADAADVAALVRYARATGRTVAAQPSGHGATGRTEGAILLRTGRLDGLHVDPSARRARAEAGVPWGRVQAAAAPHGLTGLPGSSPVVGVTGYTLGGGLSWFGRAHGWAADSVTAFDVVDATGAPRRVTPGDDLFWALRGGGGDFAIVTAVEFDLHPAPALHGGRIVWSADRAPEVLAAYREITAAAPDRLTAWLDLLHFPGSAPLVAVDVTHLGDAAEARGLLRPLDAAGAPLSDGRRTMTPSELGSITAEPVDPGAGLSRGELLTDLDDLVAETLLDPIAPLMSVQVRHLGGAFARPSDGPHGPLREPYALYLFGAPTGPGSSEAITAKQRTIAGSLAARLSGRKPFTYLNPAETAADAFAPAALARLRDIKRAHDPEGVFRSNHPVLL